MGISKSDIEFFKNHFAEILQEGARLQEEGPHLVLVNGLGGDEADLSSQEREQALALKLGRRNSLYLKKIQAAMARIEDGSFGHCKDCGMDIEFKRLKARPTADLCITCKEDQERYEGHILYAKKSHTLGKDLKTDASSGVGQMLEDDSSGLHMKDVLKTASKISSNAADGY